MDWPTARSRRRRASTSFLAPGQALATADTVVIPGTRYPPARIDGVAAEGGIGRARNDPSRNPAGVDLHRRVHSRRGRSSRRAAGDHALVRRCDAPCTPKCSRRERAVRRRRGHPDVCGARGGIDLCLHIIRRDHGAQVANAVARYCVVPPWREGGQAQFIDRQVPMPDHYSTAPTREWALRHLDEELTVQRLAGHAKMSARNLQQALPRRDRPVAGSVDTGQTVDRARELLESRDMRIDEVARLSGLGTGGNLRHHLRRGMGMSPTSYRKVYQGA